MALATRTVSSSTTFIYKIILPAGWISLFGAATISLWLAESPTSVWSIEFLVAWVVGTVVLLASCLPLKRVRVDDKSIFVSDYLREVAIPLHLVDRVTENRWINIHPVTVYFRESTEFGRHIKFMPKWQFSPWKSHPVVAELTTLAQQSQKAGSDA